MATANMVADAQTSLSMNQVHFVCSKQFSRAQYKRDPKWMAERHGFSYTNLHLFDHAVLFVCLC